MEEETALRTKITAAGIAGGVPAIVLGLAGANVLIDAAIAGLFGYIAWECSPGLQRATARFIPAPEKLPVLNKVDWNGVFAGQESDDEVPPQDTALQSDEKQESRVNEADITNWVDDISGESDAKKIFLFSELLKDGWRPSWNAIFVGRTMQGKNIFVSALDLCHVAFSGKTGGGKGSLMRLIMVQLCTIGAPVALLNPHYMRWVKAKEGAEFDEDWSPFEGIHPRTGEHYLQKSPLVCAEIPEIDNCLTWAVETLLEGRKKRGRTQAIEFVPYFIVLDEWPLIVKKMGGNRASDLLGYLLREGRKYRVYVIIASQDFQVKTLGCEGEGSVRKNFLTVFYTGGDLTTRRELLNEQTRETPENKIGKGVVLMRCTGTENEVVLARVPFVDNEAVYELLGPSTYEHEEVHTDELEMPDDAATTPAKMADLPPNSHDTTDDAVTTAASLPTDWTPEQATMAKEMYQERVPKETILKLLHKRGTAKVRRDELDHVLEMEEV